MAQRQRGAALLMAMLTVTLVATLAAATMWRQFRQVEVEAAERSRVQTAWLLTGALDWARLILREDARGSQSDDLTEPWAVPLAEARLSTFLAAADKDAATDLGDEASEMFLSGQMQDLQARLNLTNLVQGNAVSAADLQGFKRLFTLLGLPSAGLDQAALRLRDAMDAREAPELALAPLLPQRLSEVAWLGLPPEVLTRIEPYVVVLPERTPVNLNTASAEVIYATLARIDMAQAQRLVQHRAQSPLKTLEDAKKLLPDAGVEDKTVSTSSRYFAVSGRLRTARGVVQEVSLLKRDGFDVQLLRRQRLPASVLLPSSSPQAGGQ